MPTPRPSTSAKTSSERAASCSNRFYRRRRVIDFLPTADSLPSPYGCRALNDLADGDRDVADVLLEMDATTHWRFTRVYDSGEVNSNELATALRRYDESDTNGKQFADEVIEQTGQNGPRLIAADVCNSPCQGTIRAVYEYTKKSDSDLKIDNSDAKKLLNSYKAADEVSIGPGSSGPGTVQSQIDELANNDVDSVTTVMGDVSSDKSGYKQIAGEATAANNVYTSNNGINSNNLIVGDKYTGLDSGPNSKTDIDVNIVDEEITVNGRTLDSPSIESKNYNPSGYSEFLIRDETGDLIDKFVTQSESSLDKDNFVLVTTPEYKNEMSKLGQIQRLRDSVQSRTSSDVNIEITTYDELED